MHSFPPLTDSSSTTSLNSSPPSSLVHVHRLPPQPVQSLADRYARRLKTQGGFPEVKDRERREPSSESEASFILQADALQVMSALLSFNPPLFYCAYMYIHVSLVPSAHEELLGTRLYRCIMPTLVTPKIQCFQHKNKSQDKGQWATSCRCLSWCSILTSRSAAKAQTTEFKAPIAMSMSEKQLNFAHIHVHVYTCITHVRVRGNIYYPLPFFYTFSPNGLV